MVILQRWEPIIADSFPSEIPFWIDVQGIPLHYWKPKMLKDIGGLAGELVDHELTPAVARVKVLVNGLQPLVKDAMIDFPDGSEALVTLEYKRLKKHCFHCNRLSHEKADCPGLQSRKNSQSQTSLPPLPPQRGLLSSKNKSHSGNTSPIRPFSQGFSSHIREKDARTSGLRASKPPYLSPQRYSDRRSHEDRTPSFRRSSSKSQDYYRGESTRDDRGYLRAQDRHHDKPSSPNQQWTEKLFVKDTNRQEVSESSRNRRPPLEREMSNDNILTPPPIPTTAEVMGELRDVTVQYISVNDPTESAARRHRVNQGEAFGLMATTAALLSLQQLKLTIHQFWKRLPIQSISLYLLPRLHHP